MSATEAAVACVALVCLTLVLITTLAARSREK